MGFDVVFVVGENNIAGYAVLVTLVDTDKGYYKTMAEAKKAASAKKFVHCSQTCRCKPPQADTLNIVCYTDNPSGCGRLDYWDVLGCTRCGTLGGPAGVKGRSQNLNTDDLANAAGLLPGALIHLWINNPSSRYSGHWSGPARLRAIRVDKVEVTLLGGDGTQSDAEYDWAKVFELFHMPTIDP